jgi:hypothetical protein
VHTKDGSEYCANRRSFRRIVACGKLAEAREDIAHSLRMESPPARAAVQLKH